MVGLNLTSNKWGIPNTIERRRIGNYIYAYRNGVALNTRDYPPVHAETGRTNAGAYIPTNYDYDDEEDAEEMGEGTIDGLGYTVKLVRMKNGTVGQIFVGSDIVWESQPFTTDEDQSADQRAAEAARERFVNAMRALFDIVPDIYDTPMGALNAE